MVTTMMTETDLARKIATFEDEEDVVKACEGMDAHGLVGVSMSLFDMYIGAQETRKAAEAYEVKLMVFTNILQVAAKKRLDEEGTYE